ncbi:MAG: phosphodiester glycosidase family protein [Armatimonadota bacterium]|nr:phosphodiester glycosidase family protein [Armatimonadota bacterium]MDR5696514.1 phosphodiester glycosidase family protein [Armatimonadota bacterium]
MIRFAATTVAAVLLLLTAGGAGSAAARLLSVGWTTQDGAPKVVVHTDRHVRYRSAVVGDRLVLDLWPVAGTRRGWQPVATGPVGAVRHETLRPGVLRLTVFLRGAVRYKVFRRADPHKIAVVVLPSHRAAVRLPRSVAYRKIRVRTGAGSTRAHVVTVDPADPAISIRPVLGAETVQGREATAHAATRSDAVAAINGGFFAPSNGQPLGLVMIDGKVLSTPFPRRSVFAITATGRPRISAFAFRGTLRTPTGAVPISAINRPPRAGGVAVYTPEYGPLTPHHERPVLVRRGVIVGLPAGRVPIPDDGYVVTATARETDRLLRPLERGAPVRMQTSVEPEGVVHALGGGPRLVRDGRVDIPYGWEGFRPSVYARRTSRSAVGITRSDKVLLVAVEGPDEENTGMNLREVAALMRDLGAVEAMNLDGGGSSTLVVGGRVVNRDESRQRAVPSMLVVTYRPQP